MAEAGKAASCARVCGCGAECVGGLVTHTPACNWTLIGFDTSPQEVCGCKALRALGGEAPAAPEGVPARETSPDGFALVRCGREQFAMEVHPGGGSMRTTPCGQPRSAHDGEPGNGGLAVVCGGWVPLVTVVLTCRYTRSKSPMGYWTDGKPEGKAPDVFTGGRALLCAGDARMVRGFPDAPRDGHRIRVEVCGHKLPGEWVQVTLRKLQPGQSVSERRWHVGEGGSIGAPAHLFPAMGEVCDLWDALGLPETAWARVTDLGPGGSREMTPEEARTFAEGLRRGDETTRGLGYLAPARCAVCSFTAQSHAHAAGGLAAEVGACDGFRLRPESRFDVLPLHDYASPTRNGAALYCNVCGDHMLAHDSRQALRRSMGGGTGGLARGCDETPNRETPALMACVFPPGHRGSHKPGTAFDVQAWARAGLDASGWPRTLDGQPPGRLFEAPASAPEAVRRAQEPRLVEAFSRAARGLTSNAQAVAAGIRQAIANAGELHRMLAEVERIGFGPAEPPTDDPLRRMAREHRERESARMRAEHERGRDAARVDPDAGDTIALAPEQAGRGPFAIAPAVILWQVYALGVHDVHARPSGELFKTGAPTVKFTRVEWGAIVAGAAGVERAGGIPDLWPGPDDPMWRGARRSMKVRRTEMVGKVTPMGPGRCSVKITTDGNGVPIACGKTAEAHDGSGAGVGHVFTEGPQEAQGGGVTPPAPVVMLPTPDIPTIAARIVWRQPGAVYAFVPVAEVIARPKLGDVVHMPGGLVTYVVTGTPATPHDRFVDVDRYGWTRSGSDAPTSVSCTPTYVRLPVWGDLLSAGGVTAERVEEPASP